MYSLMEAACSGLSPEQVGPRKMECVAGGTSGGDQSAWGGGQMPGCRGCWQSW